MAQEKKEFVVERVERKNTRKNGVPQMVLTLKTQDEYGNTETCFDHITLRGEYKNIACPFFESVGLCALSEKLKNVNKLTDEEWKSAEGKSGTGIFKRDEKGKLVCTFFVRCPLQKSTSDEETLVKYGVVDSWPEAHFWKYMHDNYPEYATIPHKVAGGITPDFTIETERKTICVEIDGKQHNDSCRRDEDYERDRLLEELGIYPIRFTAKEIIDGVERCCKQTVRILEGPSK